MSLLQSQHRINELMARFVAQIKGATAMGRTDLNKVSENILIPILSVVYGYTNLKNLNIEEANYPGIDLEGELLLGDEVNKVAFQVTATANTNKIKKTLRKFSEYELYKKYDVLIVYILIEKQKSYSGNGYKEIIQGKFKFDKDKDILDYRDILKEISNFQIHQCRKIEKILEANFGNEQYAFSDDNPELNTETNYLNLLEVSFPEQIYVAQLAIDRNKIIEESWSEKYKYKKSLNRDSPTRDIVKAAILQQNICIGWDWHCYEGNIITFHDLTQDNCPLQRLIATQTLEICSSKDFYQQDENYNRAFKALLWRCLQEKLKYKQVYWQHQDKLFIFSEVDNQPVRQVSWYWNKKNPRRTVYERTMKEKEPDKIFRCKHFGFSTSYKFIGEKCYLEITPQWFFSFDGYKKSFYCQDSVAYLKKLENNRAVFNHFKFIVYFLKLDQEDTLLQAVDNYHSFLSFGNIIDFDFAPTLNDAEWKPEKLISENRQEQYHQLTIFDI